MNREERMKSKKRLVIKIGSSSLTHENGRLHLLRMEALVRLLSDLQAEGRDVILVSSGAMAVGRTELGIRKSKDETIPFKQALAAIGQAKLMMTYERLFSSYGTRMAQILMTRDNVENPRQKENLRNTFNELLSAGVIPVVNENDSVATEEIQFGDNDHLSAAVASLANADLLILLSDIEGLFTEDPKKNPDALRIPVVASITEEILSLGGESSTEFGTGGMATKIDAARIAMMHGVDMVIMKSTPIELLHRLMQGEEIGTLFLADEKEA